MIGIKGFVGPHEHNGVLLPDVFDGMSVSGRDIDDFHAFVGASVRKDVIRSDFPECDGAFSFRDQEFFGFGVMVVIPFANAGADYIHGVLAEALLLHNFGERSSCVLMGDKRIREGLFREIGQIGGIELLFERAVDFGDGSVFPGLFEGIKKPRDFR